MKEPRARGVGQSQAVAGGATGRRRRPAAGGRPWRRLQRDRPHAMIAGKQFHSLPGPDRSQIGVSASPFTFSSSADIVARSKQQRNAARSSRGHQKPPRTSF